MDTQELHRALKDDLRLGSETYLCSHRLASFFLDKNPENYKYISRDFLSKISNFKPESQVLSHSINYLTSLNAPLFKRHYEFIDDDSVCYEINPKVVKEAVDNKEFFHPDSEEKVEDFESKIIIYYSLNNELLKGADTYD